MSNIVEVKVPDIGDFDEVDVIEVLVAAGDTVAEDDALITLESDKASMDVPSPYAGTIKEMKLAAGDKAAEGKVLCTMEVEDGAGAEAPAAAAEQASSSAAPASAPSAASHGGSADVTCQMMVLGAGPGGYSAAFRAADLGMQTVIVERWDTLGGVCLNVGCIPSKALLHAAQVLDETEEMGEIGIKFAKPKVDIDALRSWKDGVIGKLTGGLKGMAKQRKVQTVQGVGKFLDPNHIEVTGDDGKKTVVKFDKAVIAAGSESVSLPFIPDDPRVVDSTGALELANVPKHLLVIGGGIIGLEMATVYSSLGSKITVVEMLPQIMTGADKDIVKPYLNKIKKRYENILLDTGVTAVEATDKGMKVTFSGKNAPDKPQLFDKILVAVGRRPNGKEIGAENAGVAVDDRGFVQVVDTQMRTTQPHIFAIGDIIGQPMLAHKAVHEAHTAAEVAAGQASHFDARVIPSVAYTNPEVAWVGVTEEQAKAEGIKYGKGVFPWAASGRAISMGAEAGMTKLLFDEETDIVIGAGIIGVHAGDLISEVALAIEMNCTATDIGLTIHPHPTLGESVGMAAECFEGTITDLYMPKKK